MPASLSSPFDLLFCRPGMEPTLVQELATHDGVAARVAEPGLVQIPQGPLPPEACVFERQRMPHTRFVSLDPGQRLPEEFLQAFWEPWAGMPRPWAAFCLATGEGDRLANRLKGIQRELLRAGKRLHPGLLKWERKPEKLFQRQQGVLMSIALSPKGLYFSANSPAELTAAAPGGLYRLRRDPAAPSRSYLKVEEAFVRMNRQPAAGETVIDLGAAPGGWSVAFARRDCQVTAVDNGPLRIEDACARRIEHVHADGLTFQLSRHLPPVDWLVGDMLIPPGKAFGVLKHWLRPPARCRHLVFNIKLPQENPLPALEPIREWLQMHQPELAMRQLVHDRREVTVFGSVIS